MTSRSLFVLLCSLSLPLHATSCQRNAGATLLDVRRPPTAGNAATDEVPAGDTGDATFNAAALASREREIAMDRAGRPNESAQPPACNGDMSSTMVEELQQAGADTAKCYRELLRRQPEVQGRVVARLRVSAEGTTHVEAIESPDFQDVEFFDCVGRSLELTLSGAPRGGCVVVRVPLHYLPKSRVAGSVPAEPERPALDEPSPALPVGESSHAAAATTPSAGSLPSVEPAHSGMGGSAGGASVD